MNAHKARRHPPARSGYSLLELVLATALVSGTLASSLALIRDGMQLSRETDNRALLANYAVSKLEAQLAEVAANWTSGTVTGDLSSDGRADIRYTITRSDAVADGGIVDALMQIQVTTYLDEDSDDALDASELNVVYRTKIGKFASYEAKASS